MIRYALIALALVALLPATAFAGADEWQSCNKGFEAGDSAGSPAILKSPRLGGLDQRRSMCFDTNGTANSALLDVSGCGNIDVQLYNMDDGDNSTTALTIHRCPDAIDQDSVTAGNQATDVDQCEPVVANITLETGAELLGYATDYIFVVTTTNTGSDDIRVMVRCND
jgi:hypothetical protein